MDHLVRAGAGASSDATTSSSRRGTTPAGLALRTEIESLPGGALRARHIADQRRPRRRTCWRGWSSRCPLPAAATEILDFTGRHEGERAPQRHPITDGLWLRESRRGKPGLDAASVLVAGTAGFGFADGEVLAAVRRQQRQLRDRRPAQRVASNATISAGELLLPGEIVLLTGDTYTMPWVVFAASRHGLDPAAHALHTWQRTLPAHPREQPVTLNVWEAVYFDHDFDRLRRLADLAAQVGVERFVLDDGWFLGRRDDTAGLGDWWVDERRVAERAGTLIDHVHGLGMQFGLWFEPEMVNPDSDLYREHPDWILVRRGPGAAAAPQPAGPGPHQPGGVGATCATGSTRCSSEHPIDYVKWDHNRDLLEAGQRAPRGAPAAHAQNRGVLRAARRPARSAIPTSRGSPAPRAAAGSTSG